MREHPDINILQAGLSDIRNSPDDEGRLDMIVVRPERKQREIKEKCFLSSQRGVEGDHWSKGCWKSLPDGSPDPAVQVAIMNSRCLNLVAGSMSRWPLAGDNLIIDMDLSVDNLKPGQKLSLGSAILEITDVAHTGCKYFKERFGLDSLQFISTKTAKSLRLRGVYAKVVQDGMIQVGDFLKKIR